MMQRGKILRDTSNGNGLISAGGNQHEFSLEGCWKSETAPKVGMVVEFNLGDDGKIRSISSVPENQLAKEQASIVMQAAKVKGMVLFSQASARVGRSVLIAWGVLIIAWFFMNVVSISMSASRGVGISFWDMLGLVNNSTNLANIGGGTGDKGIYALLAVTALFGPAISQFWNDSKAHLGNCLPLVLMFVVSVMIYFSLRDAASQAQQMAGAFGGTQVAGLVNNMVSEMMKSIHIGVGGILAVISSSYLAIIGIKRFLVAKAQA